MFTTGTVLSFLGGTKWSSLFVGEVMAASGAGSLVLDINDLVALQSDFGSIHVTVNQSDYPIMVNRKSASEFYALSTQCTHAGCTVNKFAGGSSGVCLCTCHGSQYAIDGSLIFGAGGPTQPPLSTYNLTRNGSKLSIELPGFGYSVVATAVQTTPGPRIKVDFPTLSSGVTYEVRFRPSVTGAGSVVPFATTPDGTANVTQITGNNGLRTVYVDRATTAGYYTVNVKTTVS